MLDGNIYVLIGLVLGSISVLALIFYLIPKMLKEVLLPKDWLTNLRWSVLSLLILVTTMALPSLVYRLLRFIGIEAEALRNVASVTSSISYLGLVIVLVFWFKYKRKD